MRTLLSSRSPALLLLGLVAAACGPSQEQLNAEKAKVRRLQSQLAEAQKKRQSAMDKLQELEAQNSNLESRLNALGENLEEVQGERRSAQARIEEMKKAMEQLRARQKRAEERLETFRNLMEQFRSMIESGDLRVRIVRNRMVVELPEGILFPSGRARLKRGGKEALQEVAEVLREIPERDFQIAGHTDNVPIHTRRFPSNWELSAKRAVNVTKFMIDQGMKADRLSAAGYADTQPVASNETEKGRQQNRRIEIVLVPNLDELPDLSRLQEEVDSDGSPEDDSGQ
jgi:chemotaxis protein MotB